MSESWVGIYQTSEALVALLSASLPVFAYLNRKEVVETFADLLSGSKPVPPTFNPEPYEYGLVGGVSGIAGIDIKERLGYVVWPYQPREGGPPIRSGKLYEWTNKTAKKLGIKESIELTRGTVFSTIATAGRLQIVVEDSMLKTAKLQKVAKAIIAHELGHFARNDAYIRGTMDNLYAAAGRIGMLYALAGRIPAALWVWLGSTGIYAAETYIYKRGEYEADRMAAKVTGYEDFLSVIDHYLKQASKAKQKRGAKSAQIQKEKLTNAEKLLDYASMIFAGEFRHPSWEKRKARLEKLK